MNAMRQEQQVDVAINAYIKPYETLLCLASLLRYSGQHIGRIYLTAEATARHELDPCDVMELGSFDSRIIPVRPMLWLGLHGLEPDRLNDKSYRFSIRYQYAWERCAADYLFIAHNDAQFVADPLPALLAAVDSVDNIIAAGDVGLCSACPAAREHLVKAAGVNGGIPCDRARYEEFQVDYAGFVRLYEEMYRRHEGARPFVSNWGEGMQATPWPLPECRVIEWCCLVDMRLGRPTTTPYGPARPFGAFCREGGNFLDTGCGWFRDVNHQGCRGKHVDMSAFFRHECGLSAQNDPAVYAEREAEARAVLEKDYPEAVSWARDAVPALFSGMRG